MAVARVSPMLMGTAALLVLGVLSPGPAQVLLESGRAEAFSLGDRLLWLAGFILDTPWDSGSEVPGDTGWLRLSGWRTCSVTAGVSLESGRTSLLFPGEGGWSEDPSHPVPGCGPHSGAAPCGFSVGSPVFGWHGVLAGPQLVGTELSPGVGFPRSSFSAVPPG